MCDQLDNRGCEVVDEKDQIISDLESEVEYLKYRLDALSSINVKYPEVL